MAINFPMPTTIGETFTDPSGVTFTWNGYGWTQSNDPVGDFVEVAGDTMTGRLNIQGGGYLTIAGASPAIHLNTDLTGSVPTINGMVNSVARWTMQLGDGALETGSNAGSDFKISSHTDAGADIVTALRIRRSDGRIYTGQNLEVSGRINSILSSPGLFLDKLDANPASISVRQGRDGVPLWGLSFGNTALEFIASDDVGATRVPISIDRTSANVTFNGTLVTMTGQLTVNSAIRVPFMGAPLPGYGCAMSISYVPTGGYAGLIFRPSLDVANAISFQNAADVGVGYIQTSATGTTYAVASDERLKEDFKSFDAGNIVDNTNVYDFAWRSTGERSYGVVAQQAREVYPTAVSYNEPQDFWGIDYSKYVPVLLQELKALRERVRQLETGSVAPKARG